jgi:hypothetical protein
MFSYIAPQPGFEPGTTSLTVKHSAVELLRNVNSIHNRCIFVSVFAVYDNLHTLGHMQTCSPDRIRTYSQCVTSTWFTINQPGNVDSYTRDASPMNHIAASHRPRNQLDLIVADRPWTCQVLLCRHEPCFKIYFCCEHFVAVFSVAGSN